MTTEPAVGAAEGPLLRARGLRMMEVEVGGKGLGAGDAVIAHSPAGVADSIRVKERHT